MSDPDARPPSSETPSAATSGAPSSEPSPPPAAPAPSAPVPATPPAGAAAPERETDVCSFGPSWKENFGGLLLGGLLVLGGLILGVAGGEVWLRMAGWILALAGVALAGWSWLQTRAIRYRLTTERLFITTGLIGRRQNEMELFRIKDVSFSQTIGQRMLGLGTVRVISTDDSAPDISITGIPDAEKLKDLLREHYRAARRREGMRATEFIAS